jgi:membrane protein
VKLFRRARDFSYRVVSKADEDNIFFMAGAISFNVMVAFFPLIVLLLGIAGYVVSARFADPGASVVAWLTQAVPDPGSGMNVAQALEQAIERVVEERGGLSLAGGVFLVWISTRLVGTLRTVLREVFDIAQGRNALAGKLFDFAAVIVGGFLILLNVAVTVSLLDLGQFGLDLLPLAGEQLRWSRWVVAQVVAFGSIWVLFFLTYRTLLSRPVPMRTALVSATFTAVVFELMRGVFSWYVVSVANYSSTYGNLANVFVLVLWIYYSAVVFILGGEIAQVHTMRRVRKQRNAMPRGAGPGALAAIVALTLIC